MSGAGELANISPENARKLFRSGECFSTSGVCLGRYNVGRSGGWPCGWVAGVSVKGINCVHL